MGHLCHGEALQHSSSKGPAVGALEMLHGRDEARLDPADAADWPSHRDTGLRAGEESERLAGIAIEDARAGKLHPADHSSRIALGHQQGGDPGAVRHIADDRESADGRACLVFSQVEDGPEV